MTKKQSKTTNKDVKYIPDTAHIIKLNEELTEENTKLLTELEVANDRVSRYKKQIKVEVEIWAKEVDAKTDLQIELQSIKSKWWYKLITWTW